MAMNVHIEKIILHLLTMRLVLPFKISVGTTHERKIIIVEIHSNGNVGYGECTAGENPYYSYETYETCLLIMRKYLIRKILGKNFENPYQFRYELEFIRGHKIAKAALEYAIWDLYAKERGIPLYKLYGGVKNRVEVGVSIGIKDDISDLLHLVEGYVERGYKRIKIKIKPGYDVEVIKELRANFPEINLMVDANASYSLEHIKIFEEIDRYGLQMIEQPLHYEDFLDHATLQSRINTPICLDESITSLHAAKIAVKLGSCRIINVKPPRVGGIIESINICRYAGERGIGLWIGGMLETGIGKTHLLHVATLPQINYPSDISESSRYWREDIIDPPLKLNKDGTINVPQKPGIGVRVDEDLIQKYERKRWVFRAL